MEGALSREGVLIQLSPRETFHLYQVLRLNPGDPCQLFNRLGQRAEAVVEKISGPEGAQLRLKKILSSKEKLLFLRVAQAVAPKGKLDDLVRKAEELGVQEFWAVETKRSTVRMKTDARTRVRERWERIVVAAAKQSGNPLLMRVEGPIPFKTMLQENVENSDESFLFHPDPRGLSFSDFLRRVQKIRDEKEASNLLLFFGPEGGFAEEEVELAESRGIRKVFLGDLILRLETAFLGVVSALRFL